jgi:hypothetical protein
MVTIIGVLSLILCGFIITGTSYLLPQTEMFDLIIFNSSIVIFLFSVFELLILVSYLQQEAQEELPTEVAENET